MHEILDKVGLPVKCQTCGKKGFAKAQVGYGGWWRHRLGKQSYWYCSEHAATAGKFFRQLGELNSVQRKEVEPQEELSTEEELYKLLD